MLALLACVLLKLQKCLTADMTWYAYAFGFYPNRIKPVYIWHRQDVGLAASLHKAARLSDSLLQDPDFEFLLDRHTSAPTVLIPVAEEHW